ncbi:HTH domain-containing protein [Thermus filiformis]|uniref:HTH HARE-type domain-containing protein n=1 Tax=Thermus filiformis TaxID=276 RepID=A0A0D6XBG5_THEFI|nr:HTH domain-containing protein [Thermus filiformis]KIX84676.1 hypothetical protein THFILI_03235 [Thermus filiformis]
MGFRELVLALLEEEGRPLHYREVGRLLKERGHWAHIKNPERVALSRLAALSRWHLSPVVNLGRGFYGLRKWEGGTSPEP